ncbi:MAG: sigma-70 family RNA polymerase sigma factor [Clostridia bacterium]|nr:sigma-70 family RNA polymerase sigma factor [Clostridia bacterium]
MKNNKMFEYYVSEYMDMLYKLAFVYLKSHDDSNDVVQNVLLNFYKTNKEFESDEHIKFWLIRCTINECKKLWRTSWNKLVTFEEVNIKNDEYEESNIDLFNAIMSLDRKYRVVIVLYYIEDYKLNEIAEILKLPLGTVGSRLSKAKDKLKKYLKGDDNFE